jgi:hypothetical protein
MNWLTGENFRSVDLRGSYADIIMMSIHFPYSVMDDDFYAIMNDRFEDDSEFTNAIIGQIQGLEQ